MHFFGSYSHSCAIPGRHLHGQTNSQDKEERERGAGMLLQSLGREGALKHEQPNCDSWCPHTQGQEQEDLAVAPGWKPREVLKPRPCYELVCTIAFQHARLHEMSVFLPKGVFHCMKAEPGTRLFHLYTNKWKVWVISPALQPPLLTAL